MALVDHEAVVLDLEGHIRSKNSFGQRELLALLADLRVRHRQVEGLPEKALRLYGPELAEALARHPADGDDEESLVMAGDPAARSDSQ